jgi:hypothetical protein
MMISACGRVAATPAVMPSPAVPAAAGQNSAMTDHRTTADVVPAVPVLPDLVTVIPFQSVRSGFIYLPAEVDGRRGRFIFDTGSPVVALNSAYIRPGSNGGIDTVRKENASTAFPAYVTVNLHTVRIGTLLQKLDSARAGGPSAATIKYNAAIVDSSRWAGESEPVIGDLGLSALEAFESILDYAHQRLVLIRLDSAGHRLAQVPGYTPALTVPLVPIEQWWGVIGLLNNKTADTLTFDTGDFANTLAPTVRPGQHFELMSKVDLTLTGHLFPAVSFVVGMADSDVLGAPFLQQQGVVGFNFRAHQFILYR